MTASCPRCAGEVRRPDLVSSEWRCVGCGPIAPMHIAKHVGPDAMSSVSDRIFAAQDDRHMPLWCPWPLPLGWLVTGVGWAGDENGGVQATAIACSGPGPLHGGPADIVLVAEEPGIGLGNRLAGLTGSDPGATFAEISTHNAHARVKADGRDTPMWTIGTASDRVAYVGEARGMWLYAVAWPADAGYVLSEHIVLHDLTDWMPQELVYGAPSPYLDGRP
jgi:hypothetical protein